MNVKPGQLTLRALEEGVQLTDLLALSLRERVARLREVEEDAFAAAAQSCLQEMDEKIAVLDRQETHVRSTREGGGAAGADQEATDA